MSVILAQLSGQDQFLRNDAVRRRNAEVAYDRHDKYNGAMQKKLEQLEGLITGKNDSESLVPSENVVDKEVSTLREFEKLEAGQIKTISLPIGKTLEETISLWRGVRVDAISKPELTTADHQLAAAASSKIRKTEAQIALHDQAQLEVKIATQQEAIETADMTSMEHATNIDRKMLLLQKKYKQAISSYSFHVQMKKNGFAIELPSFYRVA